MKLVSYQCDECKKKFHDGPGGEVTITYDDWHDERHFCSNECLIRHFFRCLLGYDVERAQKLAEELTASVAERVGDRLTEEDLKNLPF